MKKMIQTIDFKFNLTGFEINLKTIIHFTEPTLAGINKIRLAVELPVDRQLLVGPPTGSWTGSC